MKLALLYFLEGVLLSANPQEERLGISHELVDDLDIFYSYTWGIDIFDTSLDSLRGKDLAEKYCEHLR